jgi:hypothetical protein
MRPSGIRAVGLIALLAATASPLDAQPPAATNPSADRQQIARWVADLDANSFNTRDEASLKLIQAGVAAVQPVLDAIQQGSPEVVLRGVHVLQEIAVVSDDDDQPQARQALQKIMQDANRSAARRADLALRSLDETRAKRAADFLTSKGARITEGKYYSGSQFQGLLPTLEVGNEWLGTDRDLKQIRWLNDIQQISFLGPNVKDEWLRNLEGARQIRSVQIKHARISGKALASLKLIPELRFVSLLYSPVDDEAISELVVLPNLISLRLYGTRISVDGVQKLRETFSKELTNIDFRQGGFLGIQAQRQGGVCEIQLVQPDTAAAEAGLEAGDFVLTFGGERVVDFESLTRCISKHAAGDEAKIEIARQGTTRTPSFARGTAAEFGAVGKETNLGLEITEVKPNTLASEIDLRVGDTILVYRGLRIYSPQDFDAAFRADPEAKDSEDLIRFVRAPKLLTLTAKLGEWE